MGDFSDLNTNHVKERTCSIIAVSGFEFWYREYEERANLLTAALERYNNGRMKRFLCELFIQQDIGTLRDIMHKAEALSGNAKEIGKAFQKIVKSTLIERA
jgi:hypothetical protein